MRKYLYVPVFCFLIMVVAGGILGKDDVEAASKYEIKNPVINSEGITTWDCVWFGNYWQNDTNGDGVADQNDAKEPIKWRVLSIEGNEMFLLSDKGLDCQKYNNSLNYITWESCSLRKWLNDDFFSKAFTEEEQRCVLTTEVNNQNNSIYHTQGGNTTKDKVYLLSLSEVLNENYGFKSDKGVYDPIKGIHDINDSTKQLYSTTYAISQGCDVDVIGTSPWRLRSPGYSSYRAADVSVTGFVSGDGQNVDFARYAIRPVIKINISSLCWSKAGTVSSDGTEIDANQLLLNNCADSITNAMPDFSNLGSTELKGPEIKIGSHKFNIFTQKIKLDMPFIKKDKGFVTVNINRTEKTAEVLLGVKSDKEVKSDPNDPYWRKSYQDVKSLVKMCGGNVSTNELWNKFSSLRSKLKDVNGDVAFKASGKFAGYLKLRLNNNYQPIGLEEGGMTVGFSASGSYKMPLWWIVYSEFGVSGDIDGKFTLSLNEQKTITSSGEVGLKISPHIALGANAVVVDIQGGIEGTIAGKCTFPWKSMQQSFNSYLTGKLYIKANTPVPGIKGSYSWDFPKYELYPNFGQVAYSNGKTLGISALDIEYQTPEVDTGQQIKMVKNREINLAGDTQDTVIYENAKPEIIKMKDGRILMVYLDQNQAGANGQTTLMYKIFDGESWTDGEPVDFTGRTDLAGHLYLFGNDVYLIYENSDVALTEEMSEDEILKNISIKTAKFGEETDTFSLLPNIDASNNWKYNYQLISDSNNLYAVWAENCEEDILLEEGKTKFYRSKLSDEKWEESERIYKTNETIQSFDYGIYNNEFSLCCEENGALLLDGSEIVSSGDALYGIQIVDGKIFYIEDGYLKYYLNGEVHDTGISCSSNYLVRDNDVYWIQQDNFKSEIYRQAIGDDLSVAITNDGGYIGGFSVEIIEGKPFLVYTKQLVDESAEEPYGVTVLKYTDMADRNQAEVTDVAYDVLNFVPGQKNDITVTVANTGTTALHDLTVSIRDSEDNQLYTGDFCTELAVGEKLEQICSVYFPESFDTSDIKVSVVSKENLAKGSEMTKTIEYVVNDISVTRISDQEIAINNLSEQIAENVSVVIHEENEFGEVIEEKSLGDLSTEESKSITLSEIWEKAEQIDSKKSLYIEVEQDGTEYSLWDNTLYIERNYADIISGHSLTLTGNIGVNYYIEKTEELTDNDYMEFTCPNGEIRQQKVSEAEEKIINDTVYLVFTCEVSAKEMTADIISRFISADGIKGEKSTYTVQKYASYILENKEEYDEKTISLVKAMLNYGAMSQQYFNYRCEDENSLANSVLAEADKVLPDASEVDLSAYKQLVSSEDEGITYCGSLLVLKSGTTIRHYFKIKDDYDIGAYSFKVNEQVIVPYEKDGYYCIDIPDICASNLDKEYVVRAGNFELQNYSALSYANQALNLDDESQISENVPMLKRVVNALYQYNQAANQYVENS